MSDKPDLRKTPRSASRPSARRIEQPAPRSRAFDLAVMVAGVALLAGIGFVAYRTQVLGEPIDRVLPFLSKKEEAPVVVVQPVVVDDAHGAIANPEGGEPAAPTHRKARPGEGVPASSSSDNTYFGRRAPAPTPAETPPR